MSERPPIFVDTGYLVALLNRRDALHDQARALAQSWARKKRSFVTRDAVLMELANFFAKSRLRGTAITAISSLRSASQWSVASLTPELLAQSEKRYGAHPDKAWSLTDCITMELMTKHGATEAATADKHFAQAGFRVLMV